MLEDDAESGYLVATPNPFDAALRDWLEGLVPLGRPLIWRVAAASVVTAYLAREENRVRALDGSSSGEGEQAAHDSSGGRSFAATHFGRRQPGRPPGAPDAARRLEGRRQRHPCRSQPARLRDQVRIDGVLNHAGAIDGTDTAEQMISRIKVLSELDISERRVPQDGRFKVNCRGARSTSASRSCPASGARTPCCACSTSRR